MTTEKTNEVPATPGGCSLDSLVLPDLYWAAGKYWWWTGQMSGTDRLLEPLRDNGTSMPFAADKCRKATMTEMDEQIPAILYFLGKEVYRRIDNPVKGE